jgi:protein-S-isoprenylcysteine O-methyltransferase Ste14
MLSVLPILSVLALAGARFAELARKRKDVIRGPVQENLTFRLFVLVGSLIAIAAVVEYVLTGHWINWPCFVAGWVVGLISFWIRARAIAALGRFWSLHVEIRQEHEFVRSGPFRFVRHPVYFSMILELVAFALLCHAWRTGILIPILYVPALLLRVRLEERALVEKFGEKYADYRRTTPAILPLPW